MNVKIKMALLALLALIFWACGTNNQITNPKPPDTNLDAILAFGTDDSFEVVTWNLRDYPLADPGTSELLARIVPLMKVDVIAFQEIMDYYAFMELAAAIPYFDAYVSSDDSYRLAYLYDNRTVQVNDEYTIYNNQSSPFPRAPYVLDLNYRNQNIFIINNHLKAYGDDVIDETNPNDEEYRRRLACQMLDQYITGNLPDKKVIVLGDMNDQIAEPAEYNVFLSFLNKQDEYAFADMPIALNPTYNTVSYPRYVSHIDHILLTNELFTPLQDPRSKCRVIKVEDWMGGWTNYSNQLSDHRPLGLKLYF